MFIWNLGHTGIINLDKIRNFNFERDERGVSLIGWVSDTESVHVGRFESEREASTFLESIMKSEDKK